MYTFIFTVAMLLSKSEHRLCPEYTMSIRQAGLPVKEFDYIARRESGCNHKAINAKYDKKGKVIWTLNKNGSIDRGLFQIVDFGL